MRYDAIPLKERREVVEHAARFAAAGYTVFVVDHRSAPRFRFPIRSTTRGTRCVSSAPARPTTA